MFCRFGFEDHSRPVAATAWLNDVLIRPSRALHQPRQRLEVRGVQLVQLAPVEQRIDDGWSRSFSSTLASVDS